MRAMDRTLLASLGFADGDKRDGRHELACQYMARPEIAQAVILTTVGSYLPEGWRFLAKNYGGSQFERPLNKGEGKYRTTVGFIDLIYKYGLTATDSTEFYFEEAYVEVKAGRVEVSAAIRQINLYREYVNSSQLWILAAAYPLSALEIETLRSARIHPIVLGDKFDAWCETVKSEPAADTSTITF